MPEADGYVRIKTDLDDTGLIKKLASINEKINRQTLALEKAKEHASSLAAALEKVTQPGYMSKEAMALEKQLGNAEKQVAKLQQQYDAVEDSIDQKTELNINGNYDAEIAKLREESNSLSAALDTAKSNAEELRQRLETLKANPQMSQEAKDLEQKLRLADEDVSRLEADLDNSRQVLASMQIPAEQAEEQVKKTNNAVSKLTGYIGKLAKRMLVLYAFRKVFTYISQAIMSMSGLSVVTGVFSEFNSKMQEAYKKNVEVSAALANLRGALYAAFQPIYSVVAPALASLVNWLTRAIYYIAAFFSALSGKSLRDSADGADDLAKSVGGVGGAAKQANKQLATFDKLNTLSENKGGGGGGGGASAAFDEGMIGEAEAFGEKVKAIKDKIEELLPAIELALSTFSFALGAILLFSGTNVPLGLALLALGAAGLAKAASENWTTVPAQVQEAIGEIIAAVFIGLLAIGVVLLFSGNVPLGIGLIVAGLGSYAGLALNWNKLDAEVQNKIQALMLMIGGAMFVVGAILAFSGAGLPLGVGLMAAGAATIWGGMSLNWNGLLEKVRKAFQDLKNWWNTNAAKYFTLAYWQEKIDSMFNITPPHIPMPHFSVTWEPAGPLASFFGFDAVPRIGLSFYAEGGFPDFGSLFVAGEAGPELVGSFGGHNNSVINEAQLVQAFRQASSEQVALLQQQNSLLAQILNKSAEVTFKPSSSAGKAFQQSINLYNRAMG